MSDPFNAFIEFWTALGRFIHKFAEVETLLFIQLIQTAGVPLQTAQAIFTDARIDKAKSTINRIRAANGMPKSPVLTRAFDQLGVIASVRNDIVHYGAMHTAEGFVVSNALWAHAPGKMRRFVISPTILNQMTTDLETIQACFAVLSLTGIAPQQFIDQGFGLRAQAPWQYKPPQPSARPGKNPNKPPKQPRPPRSSRA